MGNVVVTDTAGAAAVSTGDTAPLVLSGAALGLPFGLPAVLVPLGVSQIGPVVVASDSAGAASVTVTDSLLP